MEKRKIGLIGLGDMGIGLAKNILKHGYQLTGFDLRPDRLESLKSLGGIPANSIQEVAKNSDVVFIMVLNGSQVQKIVLDENGLLDTMSPHSTIIVTATIHPSEIKTLVKPASLKNISIIDSPVSGGKSGADNGTLTLMASCEKSLFNSHNDILQTIGKDVYHVGSSVGEGQIVKASLQVLIGASFTAIFESLVLGVKAGISADVLYKVFSTSGVSSPLFKNCARLIMDRKFVGTGSHIGTMYKDLGISLNLGKESGVPLFTASSAYELFQAGISKFPQEDNWAIVKILEDIAGTEVKGGVSE